MKQYLRLILILLAILSVSSIVYFIVNLFTSEKEHFDININLDESSVYSDDTKEKKSNNAKIDLNNNDQFKRNQKYMDIFKNIPRDKAKLYGISHETYDAMIDVFDNNGTPAKFISILKNKPKEAKAIGKIMLDNTP